MGSLFGTPVQAAQPEPKPSVTLPKALDNPAFYEAQTLCDPVARPGANALSDLLKATYGPATVYIPRGCTSSTSEHFDGRAVDWMRSMRVPAQKAQADAFVNWLLAPAADGTPHEMARRLGIMYIIWNSRMIRMYDPGRGWTDYRSCLSSANSGRGLDTSCHRDHVHFSMSWDGAARNTSWWSGKAQTQSFCSARSTSAKPASGTPEVIAAGAKVTGLVTVRATTILDTRAGSGAGLTGSCRALAGRSLYPRATVSGLVPTSARWAAVRVTSVSNAPARLSAWSAGASRPRGLIATPIGSTKATVLVPIGSDGTIGLGTSLGSANLSAQVVGYVAGSGTPSVTTDPASTLKLTMTPSTRTPAMGSTVEFAVQVTPARSVAVQRQMIVGGAWKTLSTATTDDSGRVTFSVGWPNDTDTRTYRAVVDGSGSGANGVSPTFTVTAATAAPKPTPQAPAPASQKPSLVVTPSTRTPQMGSTVRFAVRLTPATKSVKVRRQMLVDGTWTTMDTARTDAKGKVTFEVRWPKDTKARAYRVKSSAKGSLAKGVSASLSMSAVPKPSAATPARSVVAKPSTRSPKQKSKVTVSVRVTPATKSVRVRRQMLVKGTWTTMDTARTNAKGKATFSFTWPKDTRTRAYRVTTTKRGSLPAMRTATFTLKGR
ncbi:MAG: hypothetical protein WCF36_15580 [Candidatus Nanopelagicales bacterium]